MRKNIINSNLSLPDEPGPKLTDAPGRIDSVCTTLAWRPDDFAQQQIRGLVRQVFFSCSPRPVRQVVFSAVEAQTEIGKICRRVGEALALETTSTVAVANRSSLILQPAEVAGEPWVDSAKQPRNIKLRQGAMPASGNLWMIPAEDKSGETGAALALHSYLREMRSEFEYCIVEAPAAGESHEATAMAQFADGIILVISAERTRRAAARRVKETLEAARVRILGTVLTDRTFPVPETIYQRL